MNSKELVEKLLHSLQMMASHCSVSFTEWNEHVWSVQKAAAHIAAQDARIEALEGALRRSNAVAKLLKMGLTPNPTDRDESIEQALAALGGEQHDG